MAKGPAAVPATARPEQATSFCDLKQTVPPARKNEKPDGLVVAGQEGTAVYALSEDALARAFADQHGAVLRFSHDRGRWLLWDDTRWREDTTDIAFEWCRQLCRNLNIEGKRNWSKAAVASAVERFCRADRAFAVRGDEWDTGPWLLGTPGGTVDLCTGELRPADPADLITRSTLVAPAEGEPRLWRQFLAQVTQGDEELELFLRQIAGYALTGDTREECLFFIYGLGGNGKGTFIGALHEILGDYAASAAMDTFLASRFARHSTDVAMLRGARLVIASETQEGRSWDEQRVKAMTGGDVLTARFMHMDNFSYRPTFKLLLWGNHKPVLKTVDDAWRRRFHIVPFTYKPEKRDGTLKERLRQEYPQILRWAIDGSLDWQQHGLTVPARVKAETSNYFSAQDTFTAWIEDRCESSRLGAETNAALFSSWHKFAEDAGENAGSSRSMADRIEAHGFRRIKDESGIRGRGFAGIRLKVL
jgi:putative DNA primase/helicase